MGGAQLRRRLMLARGNFRLFLPATACCCLAITVHECSDWLQLCLINENLYSPDSIIR